MAVASKDAASLAIAACQQVSDTLQDGAVTELEGGFSGRVFSSKNHFYKITPVRDSKQLDFPKERIALQHVRNVLPDCVSHLVPRIAMVGETKPELGQVTAFSKIPGSNPTRISKSLAFDLGRFLRALHDSRTQNGMHEFEHIESAPSFHEYIPNVVEKYLVELRQTVENQEHLALIDKAASQAAKLLQGTAPPDLVLIHKDIHTGNLLASDDDRLSGVIDWEACQSGPREWEFAILRQRFPNAWRSVRSAYGYALDQRVMNLTGLVQSLRFWKSFPDDPVFFQSQIGYILKILEDV